MARRKSREPGAFNKGTILNMTSIFGGLMLSGLIYLIGNWYIYGDELKRHDATLNKLAETVSGLSTTVAVLGEQNKQVADVLKTFKRP